MVSAGIAGAAECQQENFANWLDHFKQEAMGAAISQQTMASALNGITYDPAIIARDHSQSVFQQSFEQFSGRMVSPDGLSKGSNMLKRYGSILERIEERYYSTSARSQLWPTIVGVRKNFGPNCSMRFGPLSVVI